MSSLILFCKARNPDAYVNAITYATITLRQPIEGIVFAWYEIDVAARTELQLAIVNRFNKLSDNGNRLYSEGRRLLSEGVRSDNPISRFNLNNFVERYNYGTAYFDLTGLPKEDAIFVITTLLANGVRNIRLFQAITFPPKFLHEYAVDAYGRDYSWLNVYEVADEFLGFFERREGRRLAWSLGIALFIGTAATGTLCAVGLVKIVDLPLYFFSLVGSVFSIVLPGIYWVRILANLRKRLRRRRLGSA